LSSKLVSGQASARLAGMLAPIQLGVGVAGGVEAAVHAARRFVAGMNDDEALVKLDFSNAFNSIRRDTIWRLHQVVLLRSSGMFSHLTLQPRTSSLVIRL